MIFDKSPKIVHSNRLFQDVNSQDIKLNIRSKNFREISEGEIIYQVGDNSDNLFLLLKGQIKLKIYGSVGGSSLLKKFENDFFGENELADKTPRQSSAMAVENSLVYVISINELKDLSKNKMILANLFGPTSAIGNTNNNPFDDLEDSSELNVDDVGSTETSNEINSLQSLANFGNSDDELNWNSSNNHEFIDKKFLEEAEGFTILNEKESNSILGMIKEDLKNSNLKSADEPTNEYSESILKPNSIQTNIAAIDSEPSSSESNVSRQNIMDQLLDKEHRELTRKITDSIYDEIKTPVGLIKNYADHLMQMSSSQEANRVLQKIIDQANIINDSFRSHADYFAEKIEMKTQVLYATGVLNDILLLLAGYTEFRSIKLFRKFDADAFILVDKNLFYQACLQVVKFLCENISGDGNIFVTLKRTKESLVVEYKSSGPKISDELLNKLSEQFFLKEAPGLGFAKRIIIEHNGTITAQNSSDAGPEIKVLLPIVK